MNQVTDKSLSQPIRQHSGQQIGGIRYEIDRDQIVTITLDAVDSAVNTMDAAFRQELALVTDRLVNDSSTIKGVIITSAKSSFFAGGDLSELLSLGKENNLQVFSMVEGVKNHLRKIETLGVPVVAAISGSALGGGWEIALSCHHRLLTRDPKTKVGLPEVTLGLIPGAGGIVRTVRLLGLEKALPLLLEGRQLSPEAALELGLIHGLCDDRAHLLQAARIWILKNPKSQQVFDYQGYQIPGGTAKQLKLAEMLPIAPAMLLEKTKGCYPAPEAILACAVESLHVDIDTALRLESRAFAQVATSQVAKNMLSTFWFQLNAIKQGENKPKGYVSSQFKQIGIVGAGMMGAGIAYAAAKAGIKVFLQDLDLASAERGKSYSAHILALKVQKGQMSAKDQSEFLERIVPVAAYGDLANCELVIEAVFEDRPLKREVIGKVASVVAPQTIISSNTSTLPISSLAEIVVDATRFIGLHFFSPVDKMQLVEIICGAKTSLETLAKCYDFVRQIDKIPILVKDSRGFYTSRVFGTYTQEGIAMLGEGQNPVVIERAALQAGMPVGPLAVADEVSLTLFDLVRKATAADFAKMGIKVPDHPAFDVISRMLNEFGRKGKRDGAGFYDYPKDAKKVIWPKLFDLFTGPKIPFADIKDRLLFIQALETVRLFDEGVLTTVGEANIGSIFGFGFAPWSGGTLQFINSYGLRKFCLRSQELASHYGERFLPPDSLINKAEHGDAFVY